MKNNMYNLMHQLTQEQKSLWRIEDEYQKDAGSSKAVKAFWKKLATEKRAHVAELTAFIKAELK